jgi:hypothetical protein
VALRADSMAAPALERAVLLDDPLGPALVSVPVAASPRAIRLRRGALIDARDSAYARDGGTVVAWDSAPAPIAPRGLVWGDEVVVANLGRRSLPDRGDVVARWADGSAAAREERLGLGCLRVVGVALPASGDLSLRPAFQRIVRGLLAPCAAASKVHPADSATVTRLGGGSRFVSASELSDAAAMRTPLVPWLLGVALACALLELAVRARRVRADDA